MALGRVVFVVPLLYQQLFYCVPPPVAAAAEPTVAWLQPLSKAPPKTRPPLAASEVVQFSIPGRPDGIEWMQPFSRAVSLPKRQTTASIFGYPYVAESAAYVAASTTTSAARVRTLFYQATVSVPYAPAVAQPNLTTSIEWLQKWQGPPRYRPQSKPFQPFIPQAAVVEQVTPDKWLFRWQGPPRYRPIKVQALPFFPREAVLENSITGSPANWLFRFQKAIPGRPVTHTQPFYGYPYANQYVIGGPADEPERVVCVPVASRVAVEPLLLREADVPVARRTTASNDYEGAGCAPFGNEAGIPVGGGGVSGEEVLLLEDETHVLLESGDDILLE